ncbi:hypothetical protein [Aureimonas phyllosphaerae]|uniref:Uncharacterized protein n=1 Tax=Aureimonas phyllosphaerae TaxID=1166078 RepID=A0A7W6BM13_9HYPH|nr:hypothetical protein [Aureimonas phyllosphaerae]MBB3934444.1 hypothetical protein [Aureimonas phyllosphaerae]MBB3958340.1 hypothetical protein [Aureimonas phyllosphaerae]SFE95570.1 hypothetical protein SAMN05216566_101311 [Aureimonas phyllosphaerae]
MIATALVFALGALVASFLALVFAPILWSNAQRLARREFEANIPASVREMRAEIDAARARAAFDLGQEAIRHRAAQETVVRERAEAGRAILENGQLLSRQAELDREIATSSGRIRHLEDQIGMLTQERDALLATRQDLRARLERREGELAGLSAKHASLSERFDAQRFQLATAEARVAELAAALASPPTAAASPPAATAPALRPTLQPLAAGKPEGAPAPLAPAPPAATGPTGSSRLRAAIARTGAARPAAAPADHAEIRERIGDIAARVIHERIKVEGSDSQLARFIAEAPQPQGGGEPFLADRVRSLQASEASSATETSVAVTPGATVTTAPGKPNGAGRARRKSRR